MSTIVGWILGGQGAATAVLILAVSGWVAALGGAGATLYYRGEYREALVEATALKAQGQVLAAATRSCSEGVALARRAADRATALGASLLDEARRLHAGDEAAAAELRDLIKNPRPGADCRDAWREIERIEQKAGRQAVP